MIIDTLGPALDVVASLRRLGVSRGTPGFLRTVLDVAVEVVPGATDGTVCLVAGQALTSLAASTTQAEAVDWVQGKAGTGPAFAVSSVEGPLIVSDLGNDRRWDNIGPAACRIGWGSLLCVPIARGAVDTTVLSLVSPSTGAFDDSSRVTAATVAAFAEMAAAAVIEQTHLKMAITSRDVIGQAKGILMERHRLSEEQAFQVLTTSSQRTNRRLRDIADHLRETGELFGPPEGRTA